ncbi:MFS transporter [Sphingomonas sp. ID1715]|uniref:MFS transporter n=1 Tax=Sphingomonas sp. ID1715 TaxID=1656898 RepID=UPI00148900C4|nr:MFS transporter [Sphingomonas sp. ID1715]NNM78213.1 MFS transporter [Sphingomonas sp. ID1715]
MTGARVPLRTKLAYGLGAIAYGIKDNGYSVFLLLFYNQAVGLPASSVGFVIGLALVFDAFVDPIIGHLSDRTHTRWGRRHPWLYASALPIALTWAMLWHPPEGTGQTILGYLLIVAILTRAAIATNEVPSLAMAPELTRDYHERTLVLRYRFLFGWAGGLGMLMAAYGYFLAPPIGSLSGPLARNGYGWFGVAGATVMAVAVLISAIGTHRLLAHPPARRIESKQLSATLGDIRDTLSNRAFLLLMLAGLFGYTNQGIGFAISNYNLSFVWQFAPVQFLIYSVALFAGVVLTFLLVGPLAHAMGKKRAAAMLTVLGATVNMAPYALRLAGRFPEPGSPNLLPVFLAFVAIGTAMGVGAMILGASMMSDVVEASEERTGRREEGLFFAGALFMQKCSGGVGIFVTGLILSAAQFPAKARPGAVPEPVIDHYTSYFIAVTMTLATAAALTFLRFPFGKAEHDARLAKLAVAADESGAVS